MIIGWPPAPRNPAYRAGPTIPAAGAPRAAGCPQPANYPQARSTSGFLSHSTGQHREHTAFGLTSLTDLTDHRAHPHTIARYVRGHWHIENRLHRVRDVTYAEDHSRVRTSTTPRVMTSLRNPAISAPRTTGHTNIAATLRHLTYNITRPLTPLGIPQ